jgi:exodeoxyribonuclease V alpha subunit
VRDAIPEEASTVHRLLGARPGAAEARYDGSRPLPYDVVVVDEVSMLDLALTAKLVRAVRPEARLILLGDRDQLASVEAGAVLGDLCDTGREHGYTRPFAALLSEATGAPVAPGPGVGRPGLRDCLALLRWSFRFRSAGGIGSASRAVNEGRAEEALAVTGGDDPQVARRDVPHPDRLGADLEARVAEAFRAWLGAPEASSSLERFNRSRILCAHREGPFGSVNVNRVVEAALTRLGLVEAGREWYPGRPVIVTRNDRSLRLYNGDVGIALPDPGAGGALRVFFPAPDGGARPVAPLRIPGCETVYAMTVHKSQGSEFDDVLLVLGDRPTRVLTRELLYTGITRARERVEVWAAEEAFRAAVERRAERTSGLREALWG